MLGQSSLKKLAESVLTRSTADETEVIFLGLEEALTRFANNQIHQNVAETNFSLAIRTAVGKRVGAISTTDISDTGIERALDQVIALTHHQPESPPFPGFTSQDLVSDGNLAYDNATGEATAEFRAHAVGGIIKYASKREVNSFGAFRNSRYE
jgi:predicted Zn-dependent protease